MKRCSQFTDITRTIKLLIDDDWNLPETSVLLQIFGQMVINTFTIHSSESLSNIGSGLYVSASALDHSCQPSCVTVFDGNTLYVRCIKDLPDDSPENLSITYDDLLTLPTGRKEYLEESYYFTCTCQLCLDPTSQSRAFSLTCRDVSCSGKVFPTADNEYLPCDKCEKERTESNLAEKVKSLERDCVETLKMIATSKNDGELSSALDQCQELLDSQRGLLHRDNFYMARTTDEAFDLAIKLERWKDVIAYGSDTLEAFRHLYPKYYPTISLTILKLAKVYVAIGDAAAAPLVRDLLVEARELMKVTHGGGHSLMKQVDLLEYQVNLLSQESCVAPQQAIQ